MGLGSEMGHHEFHLLTSSWSLGECEGVLSWGDVNLTTHNYVHHGGLRNCLSRESSYSLETTAAALLVELVALLYALLVHAVVLYCMHIPSPSPGSQTGSAGEDPTQLDSSNAFNLHEARY